jgi:hypothetical protein
MVQGSAGYVLPRFNNKSYISIEQGDLFGHVDLANNKDMFKMQKSIRKRKSKKKVDLIRKFTVQASENCDLLTLTLEDLDKMYLEFPEICKELIQDAENRLQNELMIKIDSIREMELDQAKQHSDLKSKLSAIFLSGLHKTMQEFKDGKTEE